MTYGNGLVSEYDLVIFDLDGVLYIGDQPVPRASEALARLRAEHRPVVFATNNASRTGEGVAELLGSVGIPARPAEVLTSGRASAALLAQRYPADSPILVVGAPSLAEEVRRAGLRPVSAAGDGPVAVVQGYGPRVGWADLAEAAVAIRAGAVWVGTNGDRTLPSPRGPLPGNGAMIAALAVGVDRLPDVMVGKPGPDLFRRAVELVGACRPLTVGDRLDTDIEGANRAGMDSLLVLTGLTRPGDLLGAPFGRRPTFVVDDLDGLFALGHRIETAVAGENLGATEIGGWHVTTDGSTLVLGGQGEARIASKSQDHANTLDALRALCAVWWTATGDGTRPAGDSDGLLGQMGQEMALPTVVASTVEGKAALARLELL